VKLEIFGPFKARYGKLLRDTRLVNTVFDTVPSALVILDEDLRVLFANRRFLDILAVPSLDEVFDRPFGEVVGCICPECVVAEEGTRCPGPQCTACPIRPAVDGLFRNEIERFEQDVVIARGGRSEGTDLRLDAALLELEGASFVLVSLLDLSDVRALQRQLAARNAELEATLGRVATLEGLLPMCANCKKVRDTGNYWHEVEAYLTSHAGAVVSHSLCPECLRKLYPEMVSELDEHAGT